MKDLFLKFANNDIKSELTSIGFDSCYIGNASKKYSGRLLKIFNLKPYEANILKQLCLSLGFDCALNRDSVTCKCEYTDCLIFATIGQLNNLVKKLQYQPFRLKEIADLILNSITIKPLPLKLKNYTFDWQRPYIMGILNCTPDSFSDGGKYNTTEKALERTLQMIQEGADIIDIGGESTRPSAESLPVDEEIKRVIPVIKAIRKENIDIPISIDTRNYLMAKEAIETGADIINDVTGFDYDENLLNYAAQNNIASVIMHSNKIPAESVDFTTEDIVEAVYINLNEKIKKLQSMGLDKSNIIADSGIGFGKSPKSCRELLKRHSEFSSLGVAMLLGISRKSFLSGDINNLDTKTALYSSLVKGVNIHRVHNVKLIKEYLSFVSDLI